MKLFGLKTSWIVSGCLVLWAAVLFLLATPGIINALAILPIVLLLAVLSSFPTAYILLKGISDRNPRDERFVESPLAKVISALIILCSAVSVITAIKSLWISPSFSKYTYENTATGTIFAAFVLLAILTALQKDIYWVTTRAKSLKLDERQLQERRQVFEVSYKLGALIVLISAWAVSSFGHDIPAIIAKNYNSVPSHLFYPAFSLALTLYALPLAVAAWRKR